VLRLLSDEVIGDDPPPANHSLLSGEAAALPISASAQQPARQELPM
jgi:hypothetical protein